jgi:hypothetical protein
VARRLETKDVVFWSIPAAIAVAASVYAWRALRAPAWAPPPELVLADPCSRGRYRCRADRVEMTTGDHAPDGGPMSCAWMEIGPCARTCVTEHVTLAGVDEATARKQLCDPPKQPLLLLSKQESFLDQPLGDAAVCEGDGYIPSDTGFIQCIARGLKDRSAPGVVIASATCRAGVVRTIDRGPRLITREEAASVWCARDPIAEIEPDAGSDAADSDVLPDAKGDVK